MRQPICNIFVYRRFGYTELFSSLPHSCISFYDIVCDCHCPFLDVIFHITLPRILFLQTMRGRSLICIAFAWVCSFCKGKQSFRLSSLIYKWNCHVSTHGSRRGSRHVPASRTFGWIFVSTHGSLAGADHGCLARYAILYVSTHGSLAGADKLSCFAERDAVVSTHGSLAGADCTRP